MALYLPDPKTDRDRAAFALIRALELRYNLAVGAPIGPWLVAMLDALQVGAATRDVLLCAGRWILQQSGQQDRGVQWSVLTLLSCYDPADLNARTRFTMGNMQIAILSLYRAYLTPTGLAPAQFRLIAAELVRFLMVEGDPAFRLTLADIVIFRRAYHQLRIVLFGS